MPVKRRFRKDREAAQPQLTADAWLALTDAVVAGESPLGAFLLVDPDAADELRALWIEHKDTVLAAWAKVRPGSRPSAGGVGRHRSRAGKAKARRLFSIGTACCCPASAAD
jgi:hypothetical protein